MAKILSTLANGERYQTVFGIAAVIALLFFFSCESQTHSVIYPQTKVNREQLEAELNFTIATYETKFKELDQWEALKTLAFQQGQLLASGSPLNLPGLIATLAGVFGIGATIDNVRKRIEIKNLKGS